MPSTDDEQSAPAPAEAWQSALGESDKPVALPKPTFTDSIPRRTLSKRARRRRAGRAILVMLLAAALGVGGYVALSDSSTNVKNAGTVPGQITPSATGSHSGTSTASKGPSPTSTAAVNPALAALGALIEAGLSTTTWGPLNPPLKDLAKAGVTDASKIGCTNVTTKNVAKCIVGAHDATHHAALVGDSAAISWLPALLGSLAPHGWDIRILTQMHCPAANIDVTIGAKNKADTSCKTHHSFVSSELAKLKPEIVFMSDEPSTALHVGDKTTAPAKVAAALKATVAAFNKYAKKVVVIGPPPGGKNLAKCVTATSTAQDCNQKLPPASYRYEGTQRGAVKGIADYLDATPYFCTALGCPAVVDSTPVYVDGESVTELYARKLAFAFGKYAVRK